MICLAARLRLLLLSSVITSIAACGGGGGGGDSSPSPTPQGSLAIAEVDSDHDGLIEIATLQQLDWIRNDPSGKSLTDADKRVNSKGCPASGCFGYELVTDLNFDTNGDGVMDGRDTYFDYEKNGSNAGWLPIPMLTATFEGNGHRISNLFIERAARQAEYVGLFGIVASSASDAAGIRNIRLDGPLQSVTGSGSLSVGALAGQLTAGGATEFKNTTVSGSVTGGRWTGGSIGAVILMGGVLAFDHNTATAAVNSQSIAGGLVGLVQNQVNGSIATITNNTSTSKVVTAGDFAGGFAGSLLAAGATITTDSNWSSGSVIGRQSLAGGLFGVAVGTDGALTIRNSHSDAAVSGSVAGGLIGHAGGSIESSFASGTVSGDTSGGLIGILDCGATTSVKQSYATGAVTSIFTSATPGTVGGSAGGLIATINDYPAVGLGATAGTCSIVDNFASGDVVSQGTSGALIGNIRSLALSTVAFTISDNLASGSVTATVDSGGVIGNLTLPGHSSITLARNLVIGKLMVDPNWLPSNAPGGIVGSVWVDSTVAYNLSYNHWAADTTTAVNSIHSAPLGFSQTGVVVTTRTQLECPIAANDSGCVGSELFHGWSTSVDAAGNTLWNMGTTAELPALRIGNKLNRPVYDGTKYIVVTQAL